ncbi:MAG: hypothetical protein HQK96_20065 [Nitrospirae bacterium]|nr:hypothetical protein [Nitrospirota bacterium]
MDFSKCDYVEDESVNKDDKRRMVVENANQITLTTQRRYNTTLGRPRRPRIVVEPGSVVCGNSVSDEVMNRHKASFIEWKGFGRELKMKDVSVADTLHCKGKEVLPDKDKAAARTPDVMELVKGLLKEEISCSHAGFLRDFLNTKADIEKLKKITEDRIEKYKNKDKENFTKLYEAISVYLNNNKLKEMREFIKSVLDRLYEKWWDKGGGR